MEKIVIKIKPRHFKNSNGYTNAFGCPLALAMKEHFNTDDVSCSGGSARVGDIRYSIDWWENSVKTKKEPFLNVDDVIKRAKEGFKVKTYTRTMTFSHLV